MFEVFHKYIQHCHALASIWLATCFKFVEYHSKSIAFKYVILKVVVHFPMKLFSEFQAETLCPPPALSTAKHSFCLLLFSGFVHAMLVPRHTHLLVVPPQSFLFLRPLKPASFRFPNVNLCPTIWITEAASKEKHGVWDPMPELTINSPFFHSRVDSNTFTMGTPMPESAVTLCQSRLYPPVRDFGFGLSTLVCPPTEPPPPPCVWTVNLVGLSLEPPLCKTLCLLNFSLSWFVYVNLWFLVPTSFGLPALGALSLPSLQRALFLL